MNDGRLRCRHWLARHKLVLDISGLRLGAYLVHVSRSRPLPARSWSLGVLDIDVCLSASCGTRIVLVYTVVHSTFTQSPSGDGGRKGGGDGARDPARDVARLHCSAAHSTKVWPSNLPLTRWRICTSCPTWRRPRPSQPLVEHMSSTFFSVLTRAHPLPEGSCSLTIARNLRTLLSPESMSGRRSATLSSDGGPSRRSVGTRG